MPLICTAAIAPLRAEASDRSEMTSQVLYGEIATLLEEQPGWCRIRLEFDGYEGWADPRHFIETKKNWKPGSYCLALSNWKLAESAGAGVRVPMGGILWQYKGGYYYPGGKSVWFYEGNAVKPLKTLDYKYLRELGYRFLGSPYLWGGRTPFGIDCSGLVQQLYHFCGIKLPRDAWQQAEEGTEVPFEKMRPGHLAFFRNPEGRIVHVGIIWDHKKRLILHASGQVRLDRIEPEGIIHQGTGLQTHTLAFIRKVN